MLFASLQRAFPPAVSNFIILEGNLADSIMATVNYARHFCSPLYTDDDVILSVHGV